MYTEKNLIELFMVYRFSIGAFCYPFNGLKDLLAKASPARSGDGLAGGAAETYAERVAARMCLAKVPLTRFLEELLIPYEEDEVTRLIIDTHDKQAFSKISHLTVGDFRDWLLADSTDSVILKRVAGKPYPGNGCCCVKADAQSGFDFSSQEMRVDYCLPRHDWFAWPPFCPLAA